MSNLRERAAELAQTWPGYAAILDFYVGVKEAQEASRPAVRVSRAQAQEHGAGSTAAPGRPLIDRDDFPIDVKASVELFGALCKLAKRANPHLGAQVDRIEDALAAGALDLTGLLAGGGRDSTIGQAAADQGLDVHALAFLVRGSTQPSVDAVRYQLYDENLTDSWRKSSCPICGSEPILSLLKGQHGLRHLLCSRCGCDWKVDRVSCCVCGSQDAGSLQYFQSEGDAAHRIDSCDRCHHYIKTIDCRILEAPDPLLEDLATLHLDIVANRNGYTRAVLNFLSDPGGRVS